MVEESRFQGRVIKAEGASRRHENVFQHKVVAACSAQSNHVPGVVHRRRFHRGKKHHRVGPARFGQARTVVIHDPGVDEKPVGIGNAAGVVPSSTDPVSTGRRARLSQRAEGTGAPEIGGMAEHSPGSLGREVAGEEGASVGQQAAPAHRGFHPRHFLNSLKGNGGMQLRAAHAGRQEQLINAGLFHPARQVIRYPALPVHLILRGGNVRGQFPGGINE